MFALFVNGQSIAALRPLNEKQSNWMAMNLNGIFACRCASDQRVLLCVFQFSFFLFFLFLFFNVFLYLKKIQTKRRALKDGRRGKRTNGRGCHNGSETFGCESTHRLRLQCVQNAPQAASRHTSLILAIVFLLRGRLILVFFCFLFLFGFYFLYLLFLIVKLLKLYVKLLKALK